MAQTVVDVGVMTSTIGTSAILGSASLLSQPPLGKTKDGNFHSTGQGDQKLSHSWAVQMVSNAKEKNLGPKILKGAGLLAVTGLVLGGCAALTPPIISGVKQGIETTQNFIETTNWVGVGATGALMGAAVAWGRAVIKGAFKDDASAGSVNSKTPIAKQKGDGEYNKTTGLKKKRF